MTALLRSLVVVAVMSLMTACGGGPTRPDPIDNKVKPNPAPGTSPVMVPLPETNEPLQTWIESLSPAVGGQLVMGEEVRMSWTCGGPAGYAAYIELVLIMNDGSSIGFAGGSAEIRNTNQGTLYCGSNPHTKVDSRFASGVKKVQFQFWLRKANHWTEGRPTTPPEVIREQNLDLKAPVVR